MRIINSRLSARQAASLAYCLRQSIMTLLGLLESIKFAIIREAESLTVRIQRFPWGESLKEGRASFGEYFSPYLFKGWTTHTFLVLKTLKQ